MIARAPAASVAPLDWAPPEQGLQISIEKLRCVLLWPVSNLAGNSMAEEWAISFVVTGTGKLLINIPPYPHSFITL